MQKFAILGILALSLSSVCAFADEDAWDRCPGPHCKPPVKKACFNLVCYYSHEHHDGDFTGLDAMDFSAPASELAEPSDVDIDLNKVRRCKAAATFVKDVTVDGGEVADDSNFKDNAKFVVSCDDYNLFNNSARRFTDLLGTRIQGEQGPFPAITLPRGALHTGNDGTSGDHISASSLELHTLHGFKKLHGVCHIWTGAP